MNDALRALRAPRLNQLKARLGFCLDSTICAEFEALKLASLYRLAHQLHCTEYVASVKSAAIASSCFWDWDPPVPPAPDLSAGQNSRQEEHHMRNAMLL